MNTKKITLTLTPLQGLLTSTISYAMETTLQPGTAAFWKNQLGSLPTLVGAEVDVAQANMNMTEYRTGNISAVLYPTSVSEIQKLVQIARNHEIALFPVSTGKNWGLGSKIPAIGNATVINLERMNGILEVNERFRYAIVEPGVTQGQLFEYLDQHHPNLMLPPTGSAKSTSVMGNILDRGATLKGHRYNYLKGLEIVLGNELVVRTGSWHFEAVREKGVPIQYYEPGLGPDITGMFSQSNFGIATKMVVRLDLRRTAHFFTLLFEAKHVEAITDLVSELTDAGVLDVGCLITNLKDPRTRHEDAILSGQWFSTGLIKNAGLDPSLFQAHLKEKIGSFGKLQFFNTADTYNPSIYPTPYVDTVLKMQNGEPTDHSMVTLWSMSEVDYESNVNIDVKKEVLGFVCALPAVPLSGGYFQKIIHWVQAISDEVGVDPFFNLASFSAQSAEGFFRVFFDRRDKTATEKAHTWNARVHRKLQEEGILPYRANVKDMQQVFDPSDTYWQTILDLKGVLDPDHIIAPGKYVPHSFEE